MDENKAITAADVDYIEKVKIPEYEGYGWASATKDMQKLIAMIRVLERRLVDAEGGVAIPSERSDQKEPA